MNKRLFKILFLFIALFTFNNVASAKEYKCQFVNENNGAFMKYDKSKKKYVKDSDSRQSLDMKFHISANTSNGKVAVTGEEATAASYLMLMENSDSYINGKKLSMPQTLYGYVFPGGFSYISTSSGRFSMAKDEAKKYQGIETDTSEILVVTFKLNSENCKENKDADAGEKTDTSGLGYTETKLKGNPQKYCYYRLEDSGTDVSLSNKGTIYQKNGKFSTSVASLTTGYLPGKSITSSIFDKCPSELYLEEKNVDTTYLYLITKVKRKGSKVLKYVGNTKESIKVEDEPSLTNPSTVNEITSCDDLETIKLVKKIYNFLRFMIPVIIIGLGILDFAKAVLSDDEKNFKNSWSNLLKRLIIGAVIIILPAILSLLIGLSGVETDFTCILK